jgi:hypothetical protein
MAKLDPAGAVPWFVAACFRYRPADQTEIARNVYSHLTLDGSRAASARRQQFDAEVRSLNNMLQTGDVPEEPPAQPRYQLTQSDLARRVYADSIREQERASYEAAQADAIQGWLDYHRATSIFRRKER